MHPFRRRSAGLPASLLARVEEALSGAEDVPSRVSVYGIECAEPGFDDSGWESVDAASMKELPESGSWFWLRAEIRVPRQARRRDRLGRREDQGFNDGLQVI